MTEINEAYQTVRASHKKTLLECLEQAQVDVHYHCRDGFCGACRVQLLEGEIIYTVEPIAFLNEGDVLTCCCIPISDVTIKVE